MPMPGFMTLWGERQGEIRGSCDLEGLEGAIEIYAFEHAVEMPRSKETGLPIGRRVHTDIVINKEIDRSTPKLYKLLCDGEKLTKVIFSWYFPAPNTWGREKFYTIQLANAIVTRIRPISPHRLHPDNADYKFMEDVSFAYERITWTWEVDGVEHEESWIAPEER